MSADDELQHWTDTVSKPFARRLKAATGQAEVDEILDDLRVALEAIADRPGAVLAGGCRKRFVALVDHHVQHLRITMLTPLTNN